MRFVYHIAENDEAKFWKLFKTIPQSHIEAFCNEHLKEFNISKFYVNHMAGDLVSIGLFSNDLPYALFCFDKEIVVTQAKPIEKEWKNFLLSELGEKIKAHGYMKKLAKLSDRRSRFKNVQDLVVEQQHSLADELDINKF